MPIDLRSDTVTKPTPGMREAIAKADVGDDVYGEDPTVNALQSRVAELLGKEDAIFVPTGVMANQIAIKIQTEPADEVLVEAESHIFHYETAAPSFLSQVQLRTVPGIRGVMEPEQVLERIRTEEYYLPKTTLVCLENTHNRAGGTIYPLKEIEALHAIVERVGIPLHLDGARLWNAWIASGIHAREYAGHFSTVSVCFSKGLGAPVGSALAGSRQLIQRARKIRKIIGGGMRQAGILAAAALYAIEHHIDRLKEDHQKARSFAEALARTPGLRIDLDSVQSNMIMIDIEAQGLVADTVLSELRQRHVLLSKEGNRRLRAVTHMDVSADETIRAAETIRETIAGKK